MTKRVTDRALEETGAPMELRLALTQSNGFLKKIKLHILLAALIGNNERGDNIYASSGKFGAGEPSAGDRLCFNSVSIQRPCKQPDTLNDTFYLYKSRQPGVLGAVPERMTRENAEWK